MWDRIFDQYLQVPMQKIVTDAIRPEGGHDPHGVAEARARLRETYRFLADRFDPAPWALGDAFTLADCSAAPALFYADTVMPLGPDEAAARRLPRPPDAPPVLRPRPRRSRALVRPLPARPQALAQPPADAACRRAPSGGGRGKPSP